MKIQSPSFARINKNDIKIGINMIMNVRNNSIFLIK